MTYARYAGLALALLVAGLFFARWADREPEKKESAGGRHAIEVTLDGAPWKSVSRTGLAALTAHSFTDTYGDEQRGIFLLDLLRSLGVRSADDVEVGGPGSSATLLWAEVTEPGPMLAVTHRDTRKLVSATGDFRDRGRWVKHVARIDVRGPRLAGNGSADPGTENAEASPLLQAGVVEVLAGGTAHRIGYERIASLATREVKRRRRTRAVTTLEAVLTAEGLAAGAGVRVLGANASAEHIYEAGFGPADLGVAFNKHGQPMLLRLSATQGETRVDEPPPEGGQDGRRARRAATDEVKRLYRIVILP